MKLSNIEIKIKMLKPLNLRLIIAKLSLFISIFIDIASFHWYTYCPHFGSIYQFWRCKEYLQLYILTWPSLTRPYLTSSHLIWPDLTWHALTLADLPCPDLIWPDLTWHDLTWTELTWPDLTWTGRLLVFAKPIFQILKVQITSMSWKSLFWTFKD